MFVLLPVAVLMLAIAVVGRSAPPAPWEALVESVISSRAGDGSSMLTALMEALDWKGGTISTTPGSLFFGIPARALASMFPPHRLNLRLLAAFWGILTVAAVYLCADRVLSRVAAVSTALMLSMQPAFLFYCQYVSSIAPTFFFSACLFFLTLSLASSGRVPAWKTIPACLLFYAGTLGYLSGRLTVVIFLIWIAASRVIRSMRCHVRPPRPISLLFTAAAVVFLIQWHRGAAAAFGYGNEYQIFTLVHDRALVNSLLGESVDHGSLAQKVRFAWVLGSSHFPALKHVIWPFSPHSLAPQHWSTIGHTPDIPLFNPFLLPFLLVGCSVKLTLRRRSVRALSLFWLLALMTGVLLTHRVDLNRLSLCVIPLSLLCGLGMEHIWWMARESGRRGQILCCSLSIVLAGFALYYLLHPVFS